MDYSRMEDGEHMVVEVTYKGEVVVDSVCPILDATL